MGVMRLLLVTFVLLLLVMPTLSGPSRQKKGCRSALVRFIIKACGFSKRTVISPRKGPNPKRDASMPYIMDMNSKLYINCHLIAVWMDHYILEWGGGVRGKCT